MPDTFSQHWLDRSLLLAPHALSLLRAPQPLAARSGSASGNARIAVVPVLGPMVKRGSFLDALFGFGNYEDVQARFDAALNDPSVDAVLLEIDSPGGEAAGAFDLADRIFAARGSKPVWAIANDSAFSAAYAIGSAADKLFLTRTGGVGSIGVLAAHVDQSGYDEKQGVKVTTVTAGARKNDFNAHEPLSEDAAGFLQAEVNRLYGMFVDTVARNRSLSADAVRATEAALFFGNDAVKAGLADGVGTFESTLQALASTLTPTTKRKETRMLDEKPPVDLEAIRKEAAEALKTQHLEIIHACRLAGKPDKAADFIEQGTTLELARKTLLELAAQQAEIQSQIQPAAGTDAPNPLLAEAQKRAAQAKQ
ncbi:MAG: S49 family peptidase [Holosporales bacterium]